MSTIAQRMQSCAAAGAKYMDETVPKWFKSIDLERLNLQDIESCILGQIHGNYHDALDELFDGVEEESGRLGFTIPDNEEDAVYKNGYPALTQAWKDQILARRQSKDH